MKEHRLVASVQLGRHHPGHDLVLQRIGDMSLVYTLATEDLAYAAVLASKINEAATYDTPREDPGTTEIYGAGS